MEDKTRDLTCNMFIMISMCFLVVIIIFAFPDIVQLLLDDLRKEGNLATESQGLQLYRLVVALIVFGLPIFLRLEVAGGCRS